MEKLTWVLFCVLGVWVVMVHGATTPSSAPAPSIDCTSVLVEMADCLTFVQNGSTVSKPEGTCCKGFKTVLKESPMCLCYAFQNSNNLGIALNMTRAMDLPAACGVKSSPATKCNALSPAPVPSPSESPSSSVPSGAAAATPTANAQAPFPSQSGAAAFSTSFAMVFVVSLAVVICFYY